MFECLSDHVRSEGGHVVVGHSDGPVAVPFEPNVNWRDLDVQTPI